MNASCSNDSYLMCGSMIDKDKLFCIQPLENFTNVCPIWNQIIIS